MPYNPDCQTDVRAYVNGTRLPVGDGDLHIRKEGPIDMARYLDIGFASPRNGEDFLDAFGAANTDTQDDFDVARVELLDEATQEYVTAFHGLVTGVGNAPNGPASWWTFRAQSPELLLHNIPASVVFKDAQVGDVVEYVIEELRPQLPMDVGVAVDNDVSADRFQRESDSDLESFLNSEPGLTQGTEARLATPKTFQANRSTIGDVLNWLRDKTSTRIWFEPTSEGVSLVVTDSPTQRQHDAHNLGGNLRVVDNNALTELVPANTLVIKGSAKQSYGSVGDFQINAPASDYLSVKVRHKTLYERAGGRELHAERNVVSDAFEKDELVNEAKSRLKEEIDAPSQGDMETLFRGPIIPFDTVRANPTCNEQVSSSEPVTYEVQRVHHKLRTGGFSKTKLNVGVHTSFDDMEVVSSWEQEA